MSLLLNVAPRSLRHLGGLGLAVSAATLWGLSAVAAQTLFQAHAIDPAWLVMMRMLGGGLLLLFLFRPPWPRHHWRWLLFWAGVGVAGAQLTWFFAIDLTNAVTATFIQYLYVALTAGWQLARREIQPTPLRLVAVVAATAGVALIVVGEPGGMRAIELNPLGIGLALLSAVAAAFMFLGAVRVIRAVGASASTSWGLAIGGLPVLLRAPPWSVHFSGDPREVAALVVFVVIGGTALAFSLSFASLRWISATEVAVSSTVEPLAAALTALLSLGVALLPLQYAGGAMILVAVATLGALRKPPRPGTEALGGAPRKGL